MAGYSYLTPFVSGLFLGIVWTLAFGPALDRIPAYKRDWFAYATEAIGVFVLSIILHLTDNLTPFPLLSAMISAGVGMFLVRLAKGGFNGVSHRPH